MTARPPRCRETCHFPDRPAARSMPVNPCHGPQAPARPHGKPSFQAASPTSTASKPAGSAALHNGHRLFPRHSSRSIPLSKKGCQSHPFHVRKASCSTPPKPTSPSSVHSMLAPRKPPAIPPLSPPRRCSTTSKATARILEFARTLADLAEQPSLRHGGGMPGRILAICPGGTPRW